MIKVLLLCVALATVNSLGGLGGYKTIDVNDEQVQDLVKYAAKTLNERSNSILMRRVLTVVEAKRQLVNGFNFEIKFTFGLSKCTKQSSPEQLNACDMYTDMDQVCTVKIYESFDKSTKQLSSFSCPSKQSTKEKRAGGIVKQKNPAQYLTEVMRAIGTTNADLKNIRVVSAKTQVVAGQRLILEIKADSPNNNKKDIQCTIDIWSRPWLSNGFKVQKFECDQGFKVMRRSLLGGVTGGIVDAIKDNPAFLKTAKQALAMSNAALTDVKVVKARTQVVSGLKTYLTIQGKLFGKTKECDLEVWTRPWLGSADAFKVLKFQCHNPTSKRALGGRMCAGCVSDEVDNPEQFRGLLTRVMGLTNSQLSTNKMKITSVRTQVVAGTKYYMNLETSEAGKPKMCKLSFVEAPWQTPQISGVDFKCKAKKM